ncbi:MAG: hypothetical protein JW755_11980 [Candidatus Aminicenantes bacterium]|nr:hypothetical protein [Candidatus Aminicenantes bacterium]
MMRIILVSTLVGLLFFPVVVQAQTAETEKYLSLDFQKGEKESDIPDGSFGNVRFGLIFLGEMNQRILYTAEIAQWQEDKIDLKQAWAGIMFSDAFLVKVGMYLVPFGRYNKMNRPHQTKLAQPPLNIEALFPFGWRDLGVQVNGEISGLIYDLYLGNGLEEGPYLNDLQDYRDNNSDKARGGRIGWRIGDGFEAGYSYYSGKYDDDNDRSVQMQGFDLIWVTQNSSLTGEYTRVDLDNPEGFSAGKGEGYYIQLSFPMESLNPVISYQSLRYDDPFHGQGYSGAIYPGAGIQENRNRWTVGVILSFQNNLFFKAQYDFNREKGEELKNNQFIIQASLVF